MPTDQSTRRLSAMLLIAPLLLGALSGCNEDRMAIASTPDPNWGEANRQTMAAQIIDPAPQYDTAMAKTSGDQAAMAVGRYRADRVKRPDTIRSSVSIGSSASSSAR